MSFSQDLKILTDRALEEQPGLGQVSAALRGMLSAVAPKGLKVYLVIGEVGMYSDHQSWPVKVFFMEKEARSFCDACNGLARAAVAGWDEMDFSPIVHPMDSKAVFYGSEAPTYTFVEVDLQGGFLT